MKLPLPSLYTGQRFKDFVNKLKNKAGTGASEGNTKSLPQIANPKRTPRKPFDGSVKELPKVAPKKRTPKMEYPVIPFRKKRKFYAEAEIK